MAVKVKQHKGKWWLFIDYKGKRKAKKVGSEKAANDAAAKIEAKITLGQFAIKKEEKVKRPFERYFRQWLDTHIAMNGLKERTRTVYLSVFELYLLPTFGQKDIGDITRGDLKALALQMFEKGKSRRYVAAILAPLTAMFQYAVEEEHVPANPTVRLLRQKRISKPPVDFLTKEDLGLLLRTCQEHFPAVYPFISLLARTGLRLGEALALQWGDLDFHSRFIEVQRTRNDQGGVNTPKSGKTRRVDMSLQLTETLKGLLLERKKETLRRGWGGVPEWVFINEEGTMLDPGNFRYRVWTKILAKAELRHIRIHDLRHTFASLLIQNGESLAYVKEQMGHHSIKITVDTYGHLVPGGNRQAVDRLDGLENTTIRNPDATSTENTVFHGTGST